MDENIIHKRQTQRESTTATPKPHKRFSLFLMIWFISVANMLFIFSFFPKVSIDFGFGQNNPSNSTKKPYNPHSVDIVLTADRRYRLPMYTLINSIIIHEDATNYARLHFHILVLDNASSFEQEIAYYFKPYLSEIQFEVKAMMDYAECLAFNRTVSRYTIYRHKENTMNKPMLLSRFCVPFIFPHVSRAVFLDTDMIAMESIATLYDDYYDVHDYVAWSVMNKKAKQQFTDLYMNNDRTAFFNQYFQSINPHMERVNFRKIKGVFNGGVLMFNFDIWRKYNFMKQSIDLFQFENVYTKHYEVRPWTARTQPVINLLFMLNGLEVGDLGNDWNWIMHSVSEHNKRGHIFENAKIVHWSGPRKPWRVANVSKTSLWVQYIPRNANITEWEEEFNISLGI